MQQPMFDVFLAHNSLDKPEVQVIAAALRQRNLEPWIDDEQIRPGRPFQDEIQQAIPLVKSAAIFFGVRGLGRWQSWELRSLINQCVKRNIPVIPVLLPGVDQLPENLLFLEEFRWVCFSESIGDERALSLLEWGITGIKPGRQPKNISNQEPATTQSQSIQTDNLSSEKGIDYTRLRNLLAAKNWKEADEETYRVIIQAVGRKNGDWFEKDELLNFPCTDLRTIDRLWVKYSNGHFGFSVQKDIYLSVGGKADDNYYEKAWEKFGDRVGWRVNSSWIMWENVNFDTSALKGHLPVLSGRRKRLFVVGLGELCGVVVWLGWVLFSRIETCKL
ncbi:GUN4 domain-containing protein [Nostoc sp. NMS9]|uniref:GUN4 domain-containing protein n=1 Tax=Nostoc sp. NMS9 TaxID=2815393 RepID=UPI0025CCB5A4|nr:GUN4 domain-containing protein [Nostoc sp. NMS9]MBN3940655.1 GUN4 domain-containing protein [Nostoc sp. NMS9]